MLTARLKTQPCPRCGESSVMDVDILGLMKYRSGAFVQEAWPDMSAAEREMIITGYHSACWDADMGEFDEETGHPHADYPHEDRLMHGCAACERPCDGGDSCPGRHCCVGFHAGDSV